MFLFNFNINNNKLLIKTPNYNFQYINILIKKLSSNKIKISNNIKYTKYNVKINLLFYNTCSFQIICFPINYLMST